MTQVVVSNRRNKRKLLRRFSETFIPSCVLVPNKNPVADLYRLFPQLPPGEKPYNGFTCALHKDILLQGRMIISTSCICFHSNIFGYETRLVIYFKNVLAVRREKTAFVVPNAISVRTLNKRYLFCSFLFRESVYKLLMRVWNLSSETNQINQESSKSLISKEEKLNTDVNHNRVVLTSTSSYESSLGASCSRLHKMSVRPHTTPSSLNNSPRIVLSSKKVYKGVGNNSHTDSDEFDCSEEMEQFNDVFLLDKGLKYRKLTKSNTLGDLRELAIVGDSIGAKKVQKIGKEMLERYESYSLQENSYLQRCYKTTSLNIKLVLKVIYQIFNRIRLKNPAMLVIFLVFLLLVFVSLMLLFRINAATNSLQIDASQSDNTLSENLRLQHIFHYRDHLHNARVERMKSMLSVNLETVNEVRKALHELKEHMQ